MFGSSLRISVEISMRGDESMIGTAVAAEKSSIRFFDCVRGDVGGSYNDINSDDDDYCRIEFERRAEK